jgi:hypothetical protein
VSHEGSASDVEAVRLEASGDEAMIYLWDFGDGTVRTSADRVVSKSYALRPQDAPESTFVVSVTAITQDGRRATRLHSVTLENPSYVAPGAARVTLAADYGRVVRLGRSPLRILNPSPDAVTLSSAIVHLVDCAGREWPAVATTPGKLLARAPAELSPGQVWSGELRLETAVAAGACRAEIALSGRDAGGRTVTLPLSIELGIPAGSVVVSDGELLGKIERARQILGRRNLTQDELDTLDRAGRL